MAFPKGTIVPVNVAAGVDRDGADGLPANPLVSAAEEGNLPRLENQIQLLKDKDQEEKKQTLNAAICAAACACHDRVIRCLAHHGADPNCHDEKLNTPLHCACLKKAKFGMDSVKALVECKADINWPALETGASALILGAETGEMELVNFLLEAKADLNHSDKQGASALHWAAEGGNLEMCETLLLAKASAGEMDSKGHTPLLLAVGRGRTQLTAMMLALGGADPEELTKAGMSARELAKIGKLEGISTLLRVSKDGNWDEEPTSKYTKALATWD